METEEIEIKKAFEIITGSVALAKACWDQHTYALKLKTGEVIKFNLAKIINKEWVWLEVADMDEQPKNNRIAYPAKRGMDVRLSEIVWVMDSPEKS